VGAAGVQPHVPTLSRRSAAPAALQGMPGFPATLREGRTTAGLANVGRTLPFGGRRIATIYFDDGSARLSSDDIQVLDQVADIYRAQGGVIRIEGHASRPTRARDRVEHNLINYRVSGDRVDAVTSGLVRRGVPAERIGLLALSDNRPEFDDQGFGEAANRRVVIYLSGR
ncbi:MAG: OmpA family protein, partial [Pseudomonadota bacterium]